MTAPAIPTPPAAPPVVAPPAPPAPIQSPAARLNTAVERAIARAGGSAESALSTYMAQVITLEDQAVELQRQVQAAQARIPAEGSVVLPAERAKAFNEFEMLKLTAAQVQALQKENGDLKAAKSDTDQEKIDRKGAEAAGYDPDAVVALRRGKGLHLELRDVQVVENNKPVVKQLPHVRLAADDKAQLQPLADYVKALPAFEQRALAAVAGTAPPATPQPTPPVGSTTYPVQNPAAAGQPTTPGDIVKSVTSRYQTPAQAREKQQPAS